LKLAPLDSSFRRNNSVSTNDSTKFRCGSACERIEVGSEERTRIEHTPSTAAAKFTRAADKPREKII
jgi:hypothetical protein